MRGRRREHYQWNMDVIGVPAPEAEAELLAAIYMFFKNAGVGINPPVAGMSKSCTVAIYGTNMRGLLCSTVILLQCVL